jgi:anti-sigma factor RsiW
MANTFDRMRFRRDHRWAPGRMSAYLDDELPPRGRTRLERHIRDCPECRGVLGALRRMLSLVKSRPPMSSTEAIPDIASAVLTRLHEHSQR